jgi:hypothetical protein
MRLAVARSIRAGQEEHWVLQWAELEVELWLFKRRCFVRLPFDLFISLFYSL